MPLGRLSYGPDPGLLVDENGSLPELAQPQGGSTTLRINTSLKPLADRPTSPAFGGGERATLFVTSAWEGRDDTAPRQQLDRGRGFAISGLGVRGLRCSPDRGRTPEPAFTQ